MTTKPDSPRIKSATLVKANTQDGYKIWRDSIRIVDSNDKEYWITFDEIHLISLMRSVCK